MSFSLVNNIIILWPQPRFNFTLNITTACFALPLWTEQGTDAKGEKSVAHGAAHAQENGGPGKQPFTDVPLGPELTVANRRLCHLRELAGGLGWACSPAAPTPERRCESESRILCCNEHSSVCCRKRRPNRSVSSCLHRVTLCCAEFLDAKKIPEACEGRKLAPTCSSMWLQILSSVMRSEMTHQSPNRRKVTGRDFYTFLLEGSEVCNLRLSDLRAIIHLSSKRES